MSLNYIIPISLCIISLLCTIYWKKSNQKIITKFPKLDCIENQTFIDENHLCYKFIKKEIK